MTKDNEIIILSNLPHTWLIDIDGTILKHNGYILDGVDSVLPKVVEFFRSLPPKDVVILLTSRNIAYKEMTECFLKKNNIRFNMIIYGLPFGERIVINDSKPSGMCTSVACSIDRDQFNVKIEIDSSR